MTTKKKPRAKKAAQVPTIASPEARYQHGSITIDLRVADVTTLSVDAIVNPSNERLWLGAGVSGALREACGPELQKAMSKLAPLEEGQLAMTSAFDLESIGVKHILHVSTVSGTEDAVGQAYQRVLDEAVDSIGLVALGCGVAGMPYETSGALFGRAVVWHAQLKRHLTMCFLDMDALQAFEQGLQAVLANAQSEPAGTSSALDHPLSQHTPECTYIMRQCEPDMSSRNGFMWPREGLVTCPDWNPVAECGNGLHGWLHGEGDPNTSPVWGQENAVWLVARVLTSEVVDLKGKVKVPRAWVTLAGTKDEATAEIYRLCGMKSVIAGTATAGDRGTATAGDRGTATAGDRGTATAGYDGTATAGTRGTATAGTRGTATAGTRGTATAGEDGEIRIRYWAGTRYRTVIGFIGEDGLEAGVAYVVHDGRLVRKAVQS